MPSTSRLESRRAQSGQSLVEGVVASALIAIAVVAGLETLDAAVSGARLAASTAWSRCMARGELSAVTASTWSDASYPAPAGVSANVVWTSADGQLQKVSVTVLDGNAQRVITTAYPFQVYKARALAGSNPISSTDTTAIAQACAELEGQ
jgi:Flp pilus assembly pilin Flp